MTKDHKQIIQRSVAVAFVLALIFPALWIAMTGKTWRSPVVEKGYVEQLTLNERTKWERENMKPASFIEHIAGVRSYIAAHPKGYIKTSFWVFVVVFIINGAILLVRWK
ncbi:MAG: hypothetical protein ABFS45_04025 [Pseudomonadota bacterium]